MHATKMLYALIQSIHGHASAILVITCWQMALLAKKIMNVILEPLSVMATILLASTFLGHSDATEMKEFYKYKLWKFNVSILMNAKVSSSVNLTPTVTILLSTVTIVNVNLVTEKTVGLFHNRYQREYLRDR